MGNQNDIEADLAALGGYVPPPLPVNRPLQVPPELAGVVPAKEREFSPARALSQGPASDQPYLAPRDDDGPDADFGGLPGYPDDFGMDGPEAAQFAFEAEMGGTGPEAAHPTAGSLQSFAFLRQGFGDLPEPEPEIDGPPPGFDQLAPDDPSLLEEAPSSVHASGLDDLNGFSPNHDPKSELLLTPEERAAKLAQLLADEHIHAQAQDLVLEFGELGRIERDMTMLVKNNSSPGIALVLTSVCRQAIHRVSSENPGLSNPAHTEAGIAARQEAMKELKQRLDDQVHPLLDRFEEAGVDVRSLRRGVDNVVEAEQQRLQLVGENLVPETLGNRIINNTIRLASKAFSGPSPLSGDLRRHRSEQLKQTLEDLNSVTREMRDNAGNPEWERATGAQAMALTTKLVGDVGRLTHGIEEQVDQAAVSSALASAGENMKLASEKSDDNEMKERMKAMVEAMDAAIKRITEAILKALGLRANDSPSSTPSAPTRPTPHPGRH